MPVTASALYIPSPNTNVLPAGNQSARESAVYKRLAKLAECVEGVTAEEQMEHAHAQPCLETLNDGYAMLSDEQLMTAIAAGDRSAYTTAVKQYGHSIAGYVWRMLANPVEAEDITQETFLRLWMQAHRWQPGKASVSTWLHRIAHNLCIDHMRKDKSAVSHCWQDDYPDLVAPDAEQLLAQQAQQRHLQAALMALPERQRSALVMTHYQGLSNQESARVLDVSVDALESLLSRARRNLRKHLSGSDKIPHNNVTRTTLAGRRS